MEDPLTEVRAILGSRASLPDTMSLALRISLCLARGVLPFTTM